MAGPKQVLPFSKSSANSDFPYDPFSGTGDNDDTTIFIQPPGVAFYRPWLSIPGGRAFVWPIGLEGFSLDIDASLGIHKYLGANAVEINVMHRGEEVIKMTGNFPGVSGPKNLQALRDVFYAVTPPGGKILYLPGVLPYAQRVGCLRMSGGRDQSDRGTDLTYSIDFERTGLAQKVGTPVLNPPVPQPKGAAKGGTTRTFVITATVRTLRQVAQLKFGSAQLWDAIYSRNLPLFKRLKVPAHQVPTYKLKIGTKIYY